MGVPAAKTMTASTDTHALPGPAAHLLSERTPEPLLFEKSTPGRIGVTLPDSDVPTADPVALFGADAVRRNLDLPEVSENEVMRHFVRLSHKNYSIDQGIYPLGSCTMKYNPKVNEVTASMPGFAQIHPLQEEETVQGALQLIWELQNLLCEASGMDAITLQPAAGAHGELTGIMCVRAYHLSRGDEQRRIVLVPDSAHGTNPATAAMCGFQVVSVRSNADGDLDLEHLRKCIGDGSRIAALMITVPSTLGLFDPQIKEITRMIHEAGGLVYVDGANTNAILGSARFGDFGCDVMHFNLHKTFSTPHGGGGPGSGPCAVKAHLAKFLPGPVAERVENAGGSARYTLTYPAESFGRVRSFYGNFGMFVRAYTYIRINGVEGLRAIGTNAVLNANYLQARLKAAYGRREYGPNRHTMHETVLSGWRQKEKGVRTLDIAKRLIDYGYHPSTIYFPLIVEECLMIEPTETESKQSIDGLANAFLAIAQEVETQPEVIRSAPHYAPVNRLDETLAARRPNLRWRPK